jgi:hypothetical protein
MTNKATRWRMGDQRWRNGGMGVNDDVLCLITREGLRRCG